jgi:triosephosphate isomerase (TIM)
MANGLQSERSRFSLAKGLKGHVYFPQNDRFFMKRDVIVIGNWKMYKTAREAADFIERFSPRIEGCRTQVRLAVPFTSIAAAADAAKPTRIMIGAQNMNDARDGAFTGEISALMLKEAGASFVILGHSERRHLFHETDEFIRRKVLRALQDDLQPVLCIGEKLNEREEGRTEATLKHQIETALKGLPEKDAVKLIVAYEPVWAIGTGKSATPQIAEAAHAFCRHCLGDLFGKRAAGQISILYGGSVKGDNAKEIVSQKDVDGVLVGGASLDPDQFNAIISHCEGIR